MAIAQFERVLLVCGASGAPAAPHSRVQIDGTPRYSVYHFAAGYLRRDLSAAALYAPENRALVLVGTTAIAPSSTFTRQEIDATPRYGVQHGSGDVRFHRYAVWRQGLAGTVIAGECVIAGTTSAEIVTTYIHGGTVVVAGAGGLEVVCNQSFASCVAQFDGTLAAAIIGTRVVQGTATMAGICVLGIAGSSVWGGVVEADGTTDVVWVVTLGGVYVQCYTGDGKPVAPERPSFGLNYVF